MKKIFLSIILVMVVSNHILAQEAKQTPATKEKGHEDKNKFRQMYDFRMKEVKKNQRRNLKIADF